MGVGLSILAVGAQTTHYRLGVSPRERGRDELTQILTLPNSGSDRIRWGRHTEVKDGLRGRNSWGRLEDFHLMDGGFSELGW